MCTHESRTANHFQELLNLIGKVLFIFFTLKLQKIGRVSLKIYLIPTNRPSFHVISKLPLNVVLKITESPFFLFNSYQKSVIAYTSIFLTFVYFCILILIALRLLSF